MTDGPILIWGAGAIGGTIGAFLVRHGHQVVFVDVDAAHVEASAVADMTIAGFIGDPVRRTLNTALVREVLAVAAAEGVTPRGFNGFAPEPFARNDAAGIDASIAAMVAFNEGTAKPCSGVWRDLAVRKRPTDAAAQLAPVLAAARRHDIATPTLDHLVALIGAVERGERAIGRPLAEELGAVAEGKAG